MLKRTRKVSLLATIFCLIASLLMLVGFQSMSAKAEDNVTVKTFTEVSGVATQTYNGDAYIGDLGAKNNVAFNADVTLPNSNDYKICFSFLTNGGSVWASGTAVRITEGQIKFTTITRMDWFDSAAAYDNAEITGGATFNLEIGVTTDNSYYVNYNGTTIASYTDGTDTAQGTGICSYSTQAYTLSTPQPATPEVVVKDFVDVAGATSQTYNGDAYIGDLGAKNYVAFNANVTLPNTNDYKVVFSFLTNGGSVWESGMAVKITEGRIGFTTITRSDWYDSTGAYTNEEITGGATFNLEIGVKEDAAYYVKYNGEVVADYSDALDTAKGTGICSYSNQAYTLSSSTVQPEPEPEPEPVLVEKDIADLTGETTKIVNGGVCLGDVGATQNWVVKARLYMTDNFTVRFIMNSDGGNGGLGAWTLTNGKIEFNYPGSLWYQSGIVNSDLIKAGEVLNIEVGAGLPNENGTATWYFKVNGQTISTVTDQAFDGHIGGGTGSKLVMYASTATIIESANATCNHAFAWTEPNESKYTEYKCSCGIVLASDYVKTEKNIADVMGESYKVVSGNVCLGNVGLEDYYSIKMRLTLSADYDVKFFLNSDGETPCNTGAFGGLYSIRLVGGQVIGGFPGGWHFYSDASANVAALTAGATVSLEITMSGYDAVNHIAIWVVKVNGETALTVNSQAYGPDYMGVTGTKLAVSSATMILVEDATATCAHSFGAKNELVGCTRVTIGCANCNVIVESNPEHDFVAHDAVAADCENAGNIAYSECSRCSVKVDADGNVLETVVVDALGHGYQWQNTKNATCTEEGYEGYYACSACTKLFNAEYVEIATPVVIGKANHTMTHYDAEAPTCAETGSVEFYQCSTCNKFYADEQGTTEITDLEVPMVAHTYGEWIAQVEATTEAAGTLGHYHCDVCGKDFDAEYEELDSLVIPKVEKPEEPKTDDVASLFGGCMASLSAGSIGIVALISMAGVAMVAKRKED